MMLLLLPIFLLLGMPVGHVSSPMPCISEEVALEAFEPFFEKFTHSRSFQKKRTSFPLSQWAIEIETLDSTYFPVEKREWEYLRFDRQGLFMPLGGESVEQEVAAVGSSMCLRVRGTDSCLSIDYIFERAVGKWYLVGVNYY